MNIEILPDILRGTTSTICLLLLLPILSRRKLNTRKYALLVILFVLIDFAICLPLYMTKNYTWVLYYTLLMYVVTIFVFKMLLKDTFYQWVFNSVTVLNIYAIIVIMSYHLSYLFSNPAYANIIIRIALFIPIILLFSKVIRPLYLEVSENWGAFLLPTTGILISYLYILLSLGNVQSALNQNAVYFYLLTIVTTLTYAAIIISLKSLRGKFLLREENIKIQANEAVLKNEIAAYENTIIAAKHTRHDIRHHNSILNEYLNTNDYQGAKDYLKLYDDSIKEMNFKSYSKNATANAVFRIYDRRCEQHNIHFAVQAQADSYFDQNLKEIGIILSNLLENALTATIQSKVENPYIYYHSSIQNDTILIEVRNTAKSPITFVQGLPQTTKPGGGTGLLSVKRIIEKHKGMLDLSLDNHTFYTRIIIPIK